LGPDEVVAAVSFLLGDTPVGRVGVGWAALADVRVGAAGEPELTVVEVDEAFRRLAAMEGVGSVGERRSLLGDLLGRATDVEQRLLVGIVAGELRQGALDGVMAAGVAAAAGVGVAEVQRAAMLLGSLPEAALVATTEGAAGLAAVTLEPLLAVQPMLASPADGIDAALAGLGPALVEWKLDGIRIQAHRRDGEVRLFTRNLNDATARLPGVATFVSLLPGGDLVLDGEAMGERSVYFFDVLHADGATLIDDPLWRRREVLDLVVPPSARMPSVVTADADAAETFLADAIATGHEGVVVKSLDARYDAGRRGAAWRKVKPAHTFDLVVIGVEWGSGRRSGLLSNLHLGARRDDGSFAMVGKTFKGLTDELLRWQTQRFQELQIATDGRVVYVGPVEVVEVAVDGVQVSNRYEGGVGLRFARVKRYRHDKPANAADTLADLRRLVRH
jgi:DNA ligase-1